MSVNKGGEKYPRLLTEVKNDREKESNAVTSEWIVQWVYSSSLLHLVVVFLQQANSPDAWMHVCRVVSLPSLVLCSSFVGCYSIVDSNPSSQNGICNARQWRQQQNDIPRSGRFAIDDAKEPSHAEKKRYYQTFIQARKQSH